MALTKEQLLERRSFIGSSDIPAILGYVKQRNIVDVWMDKCGMTEIDESSSQAATDGNILERPLCEIYAVEHGVKLEYDHHFTHPTYPFLRAQADAYLPSEHEHLEIKVSGLRNPNLDLGEWGEANTDQVPKAYLLQAQFCMMCMNSEKANLFALLRTRGLVSYTIYRNERMLQTVLKVCLDFWDCVQSKTRPSELAPNRSTLNRVEREPKAITPIDPIYVDHYVDLRQAKKQAESNFEDYKNNIIDMLGTAEIGAAPNGTFEYIPNKKDIRQLKLKGYQA